MTHKKNAEHNEINHLIKLLEPEVRDFQNLIKSMARIESPLRNEFNHMKTLVNYEKFTKDIVSKTNILIDELNQFRKIYEKILKDDDVCELYVNSGLLEKSVDLQKRITKKLS